MPIRFQVDADFYDHPKAIGMSDSATALWVRAGSYSAAKLSDGFVAEAALSLLSRCPDEASRELVERGLWRRVRGGFRFHQWSPRNLTRAQVEATQEADRQRKRAVRKTQAEMADPQVNGHIVRPDSKPDSDRSPPRSPPTVVLGSVGLGWVGSGDGSPPAGNGGAVVVPEPPNRCEEHTHDRRPPPCGACAEARKAHDQWEADKRARIDAAPRCRIHRGQLADNCSGCRADALAGGAA